MTFFGFWTSSRNIYFCPWLTNFVLRLFPRHLLKLVRFPPNLRLPPRAILLWENRPDLKANFDLRTVSGRRALIRWFLFHGCRESYLQPDVEESLLLAPLHTPYPGVANLAALPITWLMFEIIRREDSRDFNLHTLEGQNHFLSWFFRKGLEKYALLHLLTAEQAAVILEGDGGSSRLLIWLWEAEPELHAHFYGPDDPQLLDWLRENGGALCYLLAHPLIGLATTRRRPFDPTLPFGVNLIGHARERLGVSEDIRMAALALASADVPFVIRNLSAGDLGPQDTSVDMHLSDAFPYAITMFCTTGIETMRAIASMGNEMLDRRRTIGFWPWELPQWPDYLYHAYENMDEIWASSRYTWDAFVRSSPMPVKQMPMAVVFDETEGLTRADFGLPEDCFLFAFAYDGLSYSTRKNPEACLTAFDRAFPLGNEPVGLVIKGIRTQGSSAWALLEARAKVDKRLFLITESLPRPRLLDLYRVIDCFVSLHRAEGFGRNIAECMGLGKPVIVTAHSGNMDFTTHDTAALVKVDLRPLADGDYPYGAGQMWGEPDVDVAAAKMRRMITDFEWREHLARQGAEKIRQNYDIRIVGQLWAQALESLVTP